LTAKPLPTDTSRRQVLCGLFIGLLAPGALAACGESQNGSQAGSQNGGSTTTPRPAPPTTGATGSAPAGATELAKLSAIPVGGGTLVDTAQGKVLLVQPSAGTVKAYDPTCTHQGTTVNPPKGGVMTCPNHGSQFYATDGSVKTGPAASPLTEIPVRVEGATVVLA
jgi:cytochrome b6-f complex iron-sulfur subunit